jgi:putative ABC transport system substrate-binding protein
VAVINGQARVGLIDRRGFLRRVALALLAAPLVAEAQQTRKIPRVGVLGGQSPERSPFILALREGLRELGYVDGQNIALEWRWAHGANERFADLAAELVRLNVDIIVAAPTRAVQEAQRATSTIPIVMVFATDPVALRFVATLARPGGNITGLSVQTPEIAGKRLELLREVAPAATRIAVLYDPGQPGISGDLREMEAAARALGVQIQVLEARSAGEVDRAFAAIARERADGIIMLDSLTPLVQRARIAQLAAKHRLPTLSWSRSMTEAGCLMSYGADQSDLSRRAAYFVDKILKGAKPGDLPVQQPTKFELVINMKTAKALALTIPPSLLLRADRVIE